MTGVLLDLVGLPPTSFWRCRILLLLSREPFPLAASAEDILILSIALLAMIGLNLILTARSMVQIPYKCTGTSITCSKPSVLMCLVCVILEQTLLMTDGASCCSFVY